MAAAGLGVALGAWEVTLAQILLNDLGIYYLFGLVIMLILVGTIAHNPFADRLLGNPNPWGYVMSVLALAWIWPVVLAEAINGNDRGRH